MTKNDQIKELLIAVRDDHRKVIELEKYSIEDIIEVGLDYKLYFSLIKIFQPITIDGVVKIYFDAFSTDILNRIMQTCDTQEQAEIEAREEYETIQKRNREMSDEDREFWGEDKRTYEELLASKKIISKEIKEIFKKSLFTIDFDLVSKIKIKNSHARQISGIAHSITSVEDIIFYCEPACLATCIDLYNKNIRTTMNDTDAVIEDAPISSGICKVFCDYRTLSPENMAVVNELIASGQAERLSEYSDDYVSIFVPCNGEETIGEVSKKLQAVASKFKLQDILYGRGTPEEVYQGYIPFIQNFPYYAEGCFVNGVTAEGIIQFGRNIGMNMIYDEAEGLIWDSPEYYQKHKAYLKSREPKDPTPKL